MVNRAKRLTGINPLAYLGVEPLSPPEFYTNERSPTTTDLNGFNLGALWLNTVTEDVWMLVSVAAGIATWIMLSGAGGSVTDLTGNTGGQVPPTLGNINVIGDTTVGLTVAGNPGTSTLTITTVGGSNIGRTLTGDTGGAVPFSAMGNINVIADIATVNAGGTVALNGNPATNTLTLQVTDPAENTIIGQEAGNNTFTSINCTSLGYQSLQSITSAEDCVAIGWQAGQTLTSSLNSILIGSGAGNSLTGTENNVICLGNPGVAASSNAIRIGTNTVHTSNFQQGIANVAVSNQLNVVIDSTTGQLGTNGAPPVVASQYTTDNGVAVPAGGNLNIFGDHGINTSGATDTVTVAIDNAITLGDLSNITAGNDALTIATGDITFNATNNVGNLNLAESSDPTIPLTSGMITKPLIGVETRYIHNIGVNSFYAGVEAGPTTVSFPLIDAVGNVGIGADALSHIISTGAGVANGNIGVGNGALHNLTIGNGNHATGLLFLTTGNNNTSIGSNTGGITGVSGLTTGSFNALYGNGAGANYTSSESSNIIITTNSSGTIGESNTIRIGISGSGDGQQNRCFIAGINGITTGLTAIPVLIDANGQLGTVSSSLRYKENIEDLEDDSAIIYDLRPVKFNYKQHPEVEAWGLIAEEVSETFPQLAVYDKEGQPESVKYHELPILLLNELKRLEERISELEESISACTCIHN